MSLTTALNNAISGLRINQQAIGVLSQNIANVNTPGYSRQVISQSAINIAGQGSGVQLDDISRKIDKYLKRSVQTQGAANSAAQTIDGFYQRIQGVLGQPGASNSIDTSMTSFFNSLQSLAETPEVSSLKSNAISSSVALAKQISDLAGNVFDLRFEADREISDAVTTVNNALDKLNSLNKAINQAYSLKQSTAGLLDDRDNALQVLSENLGISTTYSISGAVNVSAGNGVSLLEEGARHKIVYNGVQSANTFVLDGRIGSMDVITINDDGKTIGNTFSLMTGGTSSQVKSTLTSGTISALQQIRDVKFPAITDQLDQLASRLRDNVNAIHNNGSGFPPATTLTGGRLFKAADQYTWSGSVRIAVLQADGSPVPSTYSDEKYTGIRPLTLDLSRLDSGIGNGKPTMQTIIDEINNHFGPQGNKVTLGALNNIRLASDTNLLPSGSTSLFNFDLDAENITSNPASIFVTGATVFDDTASNIGGLTQTAPSMSISPSGSFTTTNGSADVTVNMVTASTVKVGDTIYMNPPSAAVNGISVANMTGFFKVTAVSGNQITFTAAAAATSTGSVNDVGNIQMMAAYDTVAPGEDRRTRDNGQLQVDFTANPTSKYYDIKLNVSSVDANGVVTSSQITYRVQNNERDIYNNRYDPTAATASGTIVPSGSLLETMRAIMVDANGNEIPKLNGKYLDQPGYLKIIGGNGAQSYSVAIDELDSKQLGKPDSVPEEAGTNRGFSSYFGLNDFFDPNNLTITGDSVRNSAINLKVQSRLINDANLLSTGTITKQPASTTSGNRELFSYQRYSGDNSTAQRLAKLNTDVTSFDASGGLPKTDLSLQSYAGEVLGYVSQRSSEATDNATNAKTLYDGFKSKSDAVSGVNLDEELANTVVLQNSYSATARVITTVNKMYEDLLQTF